MRKLVLLLCIFMLMTMNRAAFASQTDQLTELADFVTGNNLSVSSWEVTVKEDKDEGDINRILNELRSKDHYNQSSTENDKTVKYSFKHMQKDKGISELYNVIIPKQPMYEAQLVAVLKGESWDGSVAGSYLNRLRDIHKTYFTNKSSKFACLTTGINDIMKSAFYIKQLKDRFQLTNIRKQTDNVDDSNVKKIVYGYTPLWEQKIEMEQPMNLQMVMQNAAQDEKQITIGTPILINEY